MERTVTDHRIGFDGIPFIVIPDAHGMYPDWEQPIHEAILPIYGTNTEIVQDMGAGSATWTVRLEFPGMEAWRALRRRQRTTGTLTLYANFTSAVGERIWTEYGRDYEDLEEVTLARLGNAAIEIGHEWVEAEAIFRRSMDPLTGRRS